MPIEDIFETLSKKVVMEVRIEKRALPDLMILVNMRDGFRLRDRQP